MNSKNLWGELPGTEEITTPTQILKEQATQLWDLTKGVLRGVVRVSQRYDRFSLSFAIEAPLIDNYEYIALVASHSLDMYPVQVIPGWSQNEPSTRVECANQEDFEKAVGFILSSPNMRRVVASLLAQSRAM